jgi:hypothetical protein
MMKKLLAIATLGENFYGRWLFHRLLSQLFLLAGLTIITALLIASLLLCTVYAVHLALLYQGFAAWVTWSIPFLVGIAIIASMLWVMRRCLQKFNTAPQNILQQTMSIARVFPAFWAGFTESLSRN